MACPNEKEAGMQQQDNLADSLNDLFTSVSNMVKSELQGTSNQLELLEKMNVRVSEEYKGFGDVASGLRVYVEKLKGKSGNFEEYVHQIEEIEKQVTEFEAVISVLDNNTFIFLVTDINPLVCRLQVREKPHSKEDLAALDGPSTGLKLLAFQFRGSNTMFT
uniref:Biogenesis of lysosome-related organelles complex 1 subunit 2 n=1 Tax=Populus alba TaxID=43335 RepID=A0A4U5PSS4_POPAL|nr:hypothetical protein D5086_0000186100 [Populus alba]